MWTAPYCISELCELVHGERTANVLKTRDKALYYRRLLEQCTFSSLALPLITTPEYHPPVGGENKTTFLFRFILFSVKLICLQCLSCPVWKVLTFQTTSPNLVPAPTNQIRMKPLTSNLQMGSFLRNVPVLYPKFILVLFLQCSRWRTFFVATYLATCPSLRQIVNLI